MKDDKTYLKESSFKRTLISLIGAVFAVALFLIVFGRTNANVSISQTEGGLSVAGLEGYEYRVLYGEIEDVSLADLPEDTGTCLSGDVKSGLSCGAWENESWGTFSLCIKNSVTKAIVVKMTDETLVFNYENAASTESLYEALLRQCSADEEVHK